MEQGQVDISKSSTNDLKAMVYDLSKNIANYQNAINVIEKELQGRQQATPVIKDIAEVSEVPQTENN